MKELWLVKVGLSPAFRDIVTLPCFSFSSYFLTCKSGCRSDGSQRVTRDAQGVWRQGPLDPCLAARPPRSDLGHQDLDKEMKTRWRGLKNSMKIWNDSSVAEEFERGLLHPQLARELYTLPSEVLLARAEESTRAELPKQAIDRYKESTGFKEGLKRMGQVTYEYGYRVALARFRVLHPDSEVEEDPFTIHPEDDLVPMKRQQVFDDSDPPKS
ncbi:hypothetical protein BHE74_00058265 [Ensete ventricosum]|nr:hypothetical protein BHE74_00058265 [Ensete ventricosum]